MAAGGRAPVARRGEESATPPSTGGRAPAEGGASRPNAGSGGELTIDEFSKVELRVAKVKSAGRVEGSDRLIRMILELDESGGTERQVVAGIAKHYTPETLVGRRVVIVANLKPAEIRGCRSEGMVLAAVSDNGSCSLVTVDDGAAVGARVR
ncbi:MAG: methionine--tRNA ligase subunit beta [Firmicutes bacterium]|nr:methionine--tRNA ligase subunit beta [Bacillota bacterium]